MSLLDLILGNGGREAPSPQNGLMGLMTGQAMNAAANETLMPTYAPDAREAAASLSKQRFEKPDPLSMMFELAGGPAMGAIKRPLTQGIKAYHSSPHDFDKFDLSKIGTGEGAQAYGHGIYAAESAAVSGRGGQYDQQFTQRMQAGAPKLLEKYGGDIGAAENAARAEIARLNAIPNAGNDPQKLASLLETQQERLKALDLFKRTGEFPKSHIYEVNINARPEQFLDWDKPLSQQSEAVRQAISSHPLARRLEGNDVVRGQLTAPTGEAIVGRAGRDASGSSSLMEAGIPGIKYLDQGSRATGDGSRNYVVFDDKLIDILKKYGLAGASPLGALMMGGNDQAQAAP